MFAVSDVAREGVGAYNGAVVAGTDEALLHLHSIKGVAPSHTSAVVVKCVERRRTRSHCEVRLERRALNVGSASPKFTATAPSISADAAASPHSPPSSAAAPVDLSARA